MPKIKIRISLLSTGLVILSLLLFLFALPHTLEDFATGMPARAGVSSVTLAYVVAGLFSLQGLGLFWVGRKLRRGYVIHAALGLFWPIVAGTAQLPAILSQSSYRAGFISIFYVGGMIVVGILIFVLSLLSLLVLRADVAR